MHCRLRGPGETPRPVLPIAVKAECINGEVLSQ